MDELKTKRKEKEIQKKKMNARKSRQKVRREKN
jgi:hypothetical protein